MGVRKRRENNAWKGVGVPMRVHHELGSNLSLGFRREHSVQGRKKAKEILNALKG